MPSTLRISGLNWAARHKSKFSGVISCENPGAASKDRLRLYGPNKPEQLRLTFVDMDRPAPDPYGSHFEFRLAAEDDVRSALAFAEKHDSLLVHCTAGVGRSPAIGLAILASQGGPGNEEDALNKLLITRPESVPNLHIVALADSILGRSGALVAAVRAFDARQPANGLRRVLNRRAHLMDGVPEALWDVPDKSVLPWYANEDDYVRYLEKAGRV